MRKRNFKDLFFKSMLFKIRFTNRDLMKIEKRKI